jgi:hypothetical protein
MPQSCSKNSVDSLTKINTSTLMFEYSQRKENQQLKTSLPETMLDKRLLPALSKMIISHDIIQMLEILCRKGF